MRPARATTIAIFALGGEGGGVLADWLVDLAESNGCVAQATSVPGVAQRTGATVYYVEFLAQDRVPPGARPVFALGPVPGEVDIVVASELMEAARALQRGLVSAGRTTLVASTHRVYSMTERMAMGDGRVDSAAILDGARAAALRLVAADFGAVAERCRSPIGAVLYGALAGSGALPFDRDAFEATIRRGGVGVGTSLAAFAAGYELARGSEVEDASHAAESAPALGPRLAELDARIGERFPAAARATLRHAVLRLADYQDVAYAGEYLDRLEPLGGAASADLLDETARHLALWMSYEDAVRVADLKTRASRFERVAAEVRLATGQQLAIHEYLHPRTEEIADVLPARFGRWLLGTPWARAGVDRLCRRGRVVGTSTLRGFVLLYAVASLRGMRRRSLRFATERRRIDEWLAEIARLAPAQPALALELARSQRLVKGYGDTHARGWAAFQRLMTELPRLEPRPDAAQRLHDLNRAALADDGGRALDELLAAAPVEARGARNDNHPKETTT